MASKRKSDREGDDRNPKIPEQQSKRRHGDSEVQMPTCYDIGNLRIPITIRELASSIGGLVGRLVGQEVSRQLSRSFSGLQICRSPSSVHHVGAKPTHELRFANRVASTIFSNSKMKKPVQIELVDARTQAIIREGPLSSVKIKICVLDGVFGSKDWTASQFDAHILRPRDGKEPLLKGETLIRLQNGVVTITNLELTDNSHCTKSGNFRLGAKVAESSPIDHEELNIREGISEPFQVKDKRGEVYQKHHPPSLGDEIWRLEKIAKNGEIRKQLCSDGIKTVKDLLRWYTTNPSSLKQKFGKNWKTIIKHAEECDMNEYDYSEYIYPTNQQPGQVRLLFDPIYKLVGVALYGQNYRRPDTLTEAEDKNVVERVKQHAYNNLKHMIPINEATATTLLSQLAASPNQRNFIPGVPTAHQVQAENLAGSTSHLYFNYQLEALPPDLGQPSFTSGTYNKLNADSLAELGEMPQYGFAWGDDLLPGMYDIGLWEFPVEPDSYSKEKSNNSKIRTVWYKIKNAFKWVISVRREAAAKRRIAKPLCYNY